MSEEERAKYWTVYEEYQNQKPQQIARYGSERIQQVLASVMSDKDADTLQILADMADELDEMTKKMEMQGGPNVYSGKGPGFAE